MIDIGKGIAHSGDHGSDISYDAANRAIVMFGSTSPCQCRAHACLPLFAFNGDPQSGALRARGIEPSYGFDIFDRLSPFWQLRLWKGLPSTISSPSISLSFHHHTIRIFHSTSDILPNQCCVSSEDEPARLVATTSTALLPYVSSCSPFESLHSSIHTYTDEAQRC